MAALWAHNFAEHEMGGLSFKSGRDTDKWPTKMTTNKKTGSKAKYLAKKRKKEEKKENSNEVDVK